LLISLANYLDAGSLGAAVPRALLVLLAVLALAGCGGDDPPPPDPAAVRLTIEAPADSSTVQDPTVKLDAGVNVIDVSATMPGRSSAFAALRVTYDPRVRIPDLAGTVDEEAAGQLEKLGLDVELEAVGGFFDELRSGPRRVCESDPPAGTEVDPGSTVTLRTKKTC
jgi:predicted small lipoprotein YifL